MISYKKFIKILKKSFYRLHNPNDMRNDSFSRSEHDENTEKFTARKRRGKTRPCKAVNEWVKPPLQSPKIANC